MTISQIRDLARTLTYTTSTQVSDANALAFMNIVYTDMLNRIISDVNEDFFFEEWKADTAINQNEYSLPEIIEGTQDGLQKILRVEVKYDDNDTYRTCDIRTIDQFEQDVAYYETNQDDTNPIVLIQDESVFIYPTPTQEIVGGVKLYGIKDLQELAEADASSTTAVKIPRQYHKVIATGMKQYIYASRGLINEKNDAVNDYEREINKMVGDLSDRYMSPITTSLPDLSNLE